MRNLQGLMNASVFATNGRVGKVENIFFDDQSWKVRYLVLHLRGWRVRREVVIPVTVVAQLDWDKKSIRLGLTKKQVQNSPEVDSTKPVSRQQQTALREYYGWPADWGEFTGEFDLPSIPTGRDYPVRGKEDPHLRSVAHVTGYKVYAGKGSIGRLDEFVVDENSWHIDFLHVKAGNWLHSRTFPISTDLVKSFSWANYRVDVKAA